MCDLQCIHNFYIYTDGTLHIRSNSGFSALLKDTTTGNRTSNPLITKRLLYHCTTTFPSMSTTCITVTPRQRTCFLVCNSEATQVWMKQLSGFLHGHSRTLWTKVNKLHQKRIVFVVVMAPSSSACLTVTTSLMSFDLCMIIKLNLYLLKSVADIWSQTKKRVSLRLLHLFFSEQSPPLNKTHDVLM